MACDSSMCYCPDARHLAAATTHDCVFVEEEEPSGRLVLPPCIICGCTALSALEQLAGGK